MIIANMKIPIEVECGLPVIIALKMNGMTVVIAQVFGSSTCQIKSSWNGEPSPVSSQVTSRAHTATIIENTNWNFSFREAKDLELIGCSSCESIQMYSLRAYLSERVPWFP